MEAHCQCHLIHNLHNPLPSPLTIYICHCTYCNAQFSSTYDLTVIWVGGQARSFLVEVEVSNIFSFAQVRILVSAYLVRNVETRFMTLWMWLYPLSQKEGDAGLFLQEIPFDSIFGYIDINVFACAIDFSLKQWEAACVCNHGAGP